MIHSYFPDHKMSEKKEKHRLFFFRFKLYFKQDLKESMTAYLRKIIIACGMMSQKPDTGNKHTPIKLITRRWMPTNFGMSIPLFRISQFINSAIINIRTPTNKNQKAAALLA
ncbi:hypothetical protein PMSD_27960 [Paenibacillus macquariensis subsp. defensor]|nr:hypothetical protein PMSD_27960 [Paenibacillus macquariensis subsp. defensor]